MIEIISSKEFWYTFAGGAGSILITATLWLMIYYGKKYLTRRNAFDIFSRNILQVKKDFHSILEKIIERVRLANDIMIECQSLDIQSKEILAEFSRLIMAINSMEINNPNDAQYEVKLKELIASSMVKLKDKEYKYFQNSINRFFLLNKKGNDEKIAMDLNILISELAKVVPPYTNINTILQYFDFKIPSLQEIDNDRLGFLNTKHRNIIEKYNDIIKRSHVVENNYNIILKDVSNIKMERQFILNVAIVHINLNNSVLNLINTVEDLIKENNLVREDFRLTTLPENTFNKTKFYWRPIFWIFRWFA